MRVCFWLFVVLELQQQRLKDIKIWFMAGITSATLLEAARAFHARQDFSTTRLPRISLKYGQ
jgi:hypothetical protein